MAQYGTGPAFTGAYLNFFCEAMHTNLVERLGPAERMWLDYALSSVKRGRDLVGAISATRKFRNARFLDVGCGFGGVLVAAAEQGAAATGIEIDPQRLEFTRANLRDFQLDRRVAAMLANATGPELPHDLGQFDIITCNDVAEHVDDIHALFANLSALLKPGGMVYLEVPNRNAVDFVAADGHFSLFGITLLNHKEARAYHHQVFNVPHYDVGEYYSLDEYLRLLEAHGMSPQLVGSLYHPARPLAELDNELAKLDAAAARFQLEGPVHSLVMERYTHYREQMEQDRRQLDAGRFGQLYQRSFWTFAAGKR